MQSAPSAPDPATTAAAQSGSNKETALYQAGLNDVNQNTPLGSISYNINPTPGSTFDQTGYNDALSAWQAAQNQPQGTTLNPDGTKSSNPLTGAPQPTQDQYTSGGNGVPQVTSNVTLNPDVQSALTQNIQTTGKEAGIAGSYLDQVKNVLQNPYNTSNAGQAPTPDAAYQQKIMDTQNKLQQPYIDRSNEQLQASLAAQGITRGSAAYDNAMMDQNNSLNNLQEQNTLNATQQEQSQFAMDQSAYQQQLQNYQQNYTMPLNEFSALQSGSQVAQPQFQSPLGATSVNPTNVSSIYQNAYNQQAANANSNNQGIFGLGGAALTAAAAFA